MKLTKLQRYTAYVLLFDLMQNDINFKILSRIGFCYLWNTLNGRMLHRTMRSDLPELYANRTRKGKADLFWFENHFERKCALKQCIKETEPK